MAISLSPEMFFLCFWLKIHNLNCLHEACYFQNCSLRSKFPFPYISCLLFPSPLFLPTIYLFLLSFLPVSLPLPHPFLSCFLFPLPPWFIKTKMERGGPRKTEKLSHLWPPANQKSLRSGTNTFLPQARMYFVLTWLSRHSWGQCIPSCFLDGSCLCSQLRG